MEQLITLGDWDWVLDVELMRNIYAIKAFLPQIKQRGEGRSHRVSGLFGWICARPLGLVPIISLTIVVVSIIVYWRRKERDLAAAAERANTRAIGRPIGPPSCDAVPAAMIDGTPTKLR